MKSDTGIDTKADAGKHIRVVSHGVMDIAPEEAMKLGQEFDNSGHSNHSAAGALLQHVLDHCHRHGIAYRLMARHMMGYGVLRLEAGNPMPEVSADPQALVDRAIAEGRDFDAFYQPGHGTAIRLARGLHALNRYRPIPV